MDIFKNADKLKTKGGKIMKSFRKFIGKLNNETRETQANENKELLKKLNYLKKKMERIKSGR